MAESDVIWYQTNSYSSGNFATVHFQIPHSIRMTLLFTQTGILEYEIIRE